MLNLYYDELIGKTEEYEEKKYLMVDDYTLDKVLDKIKRISTEALEDAQILINANDKFPNDITLKNAVILMTCVIKDDHKFYPQLFLEEALYDELNTTQST